VHDYLYKYISNNISVSTLLMFVSEFTVHLCFTSINGSLKLMFVNVSYHNVG
jgi:hypothetical protein